MDNTDDELVQLEGQISYEAFLYNKRKQNENKKSSVLQGQMSFDDFITANEQKLVKNREQKVSKKADKQNNGEIFDKSISEVIHSSMIPYTEYVVMDRALPRVEDGLKPVQRRILYSMLELGLTPEKPYRKSARIVGDCMGKYHPHGDSSVYDAMVRMAQSYSLRETLIDGHGNFGSIDGDSPAAMRYTEAKLTSLALELLKDLHRNTVSWSYNFDDTIKEPDMLPGKFPNLLVNGATGIAVGLATNIPPHNLGEVIDGVCAFIKNPKISLPDLMKHIKGPDFPTGGVMIVGESLTHAYKNGKGKIVLRAKIDVETDKDKKNIVITELPYQVNKASLLQKIAELREAKKPELEYIGEILDESDRNGMRAVIKIKNGGDVSSILDFLYKNTQLEMQYNINMVAIAGGKPKQMGLKEIIEYYVNYQREVLVRKSEFDLKNAEAREHIVEGLLIAIDQIDLIISIIRKSQSVSEAKQTLIEKIKLTEIQAQAILDIRLARLVNLEILKLQQEYKDLQENIKYLKEVLNSQTLQYKIISSELKDIKKRFGNERKTTIITEEITQENEEIVPAIKESKIIRTCVISLTADKKLKNSVIENEKSKIKKVENINNLNDIVLDQIDCFSNTELLIFTNLGNCLKLRAEEIPDIKTNKKGWLIQDLNLKVEFNERPIKIIPASILSETENESVGSIAENKEKNKKNINATVVFYTKFGMIKKTLLEEYLISKSYFRALNIKEKDEVINVEIEKTADCLILISRKGYSLKIKPDEVPLQKRMASGVKAINLADDSLIFAGQTEKSGCITLVTSNGLAKKVPIGDYELMRRNRKGLKTITFKGNAHLVFAKYWQEPADLIIHFGKDFQIFNASKIIYDSRISTGKNIIKSEFSNIFEKI